MRVRGAMSHFGLMAAILVVGGCASNNQGDIEASTSALIADQTHNSGTPGFFFLDPIVPDPPRTFTGPFESRLAPVVRIDRIDPVSAKIISTIATLRATESGIERVRRHPRREFYIARWHTFRYGLNPAYTYRIRVLAGNKELGFADVDVVRTIAELRSVDIKKYVPLLNGAILPIKFRIERKAVDRDEDGVPDWLDNCPTVPNPPVAMRLDPIPSKHTPSGCDHHHDDCDPQEVDCWSPVAYRQQDTDGDGIGDACECLNVTCAPSDACHAAGTCSSATGACSNPPLPDSDADGTCDAVDACPADPNKTSPGRCGCGVPETDADGDGIPDCVDGCPLDRLKAAPGVCGCGISDQDTDGDGTPDCNDACPGDASKSGAGTCGCGRPDSDTDGDGVADCNDLCPLDKNKLAPGACGCGVPDADTDGDGSPDCKDACPSDPTKSSSPGLCGCGVSDLDGDGDGVPDCNDGCPKDGSKRLPGLCGCGASDVDGDGDSVPDCLDLCPADPAKQAPGVCGCGAADIDTDGDGTPDCVDACPNDVRKVSVGACGCGSEDTDTDHDGIADCLDGCINDPQKSAPGSCGCGVSDQDRDVDGTPDCKDECPNDPGKKAPGICGCGVSDQDTDADGIPDCNDACPGDASKSGAGTCGCGTPDSDTDGDGALDCQDSCPTDPWKTSPGACGCNVSDLDSDADGIPDCLDLCPLDPNKRSPGLCGCGTSDVDSDRDGVPDCSDACPADFLKTQPGICGCGAADVDSDGDGVLDCQDACPTDAAKASLGACGCNVADTDSDSDGVADCKDLCAADPAKSAPGACGCGMSDLDSDGDGLADCQDRCPADPAKTEPGVCGCGRADADADGDGVADCNDECPLDPAKAAPGVCGCAVADLDSDRDGTYDCKDLCPTDPRKVTPGQCGCGALETDSDGDGIPDCTDACPTDVAKSAPGFCGCGISDLDTDKDGTPDCQDRCPADPGKTNPGSCGCGAPDTDSDGDGVANCVDSCPNTPNPDQLDSDGDGIGDACECESVRCQAADACHLAGACDPKTGACSNPAQPDGSPCSDGDRCTQTDTCRAGVCVGSNPVTCAASDACHLAGACDPATGTCTNPMAPDGASCDDGDACTRSDACQAGVCVGSNPVICAAADACHAAGTCNRQSGLCTNPIQPDGTACDDSDPQTVRDACASGACSGVRSNCNLTYFDDDLAFVHQQGDGSERALSVCNVKPNLSSAALSQLSYGSACVQGAGVFDITSFSNAEKENFVLRISEEIAKQKHITTATRAYGVQLLGTAYAFLTQGADACSCNSTTFSYSGSAPEHRMISLTWASHTFCALPGSNPYLGSLYASTLTPLLWPGYNYNDVRAYGAAPYYDGDCAYCTNRPLRILGATDVPYGARNECGRGASVGLPNGVVCARAPNQVADSFDGSALDGAWTVPVGSGPTYTVADGWLRITDAAFASTPSTPTNSWIYDPDVDRGNQLAWSQPVGARSFDLSFSFDWSSSSPELTLAGVGLTNANNLLEVYAGVSDGSSSAFGAPFVIVRAPTASKDASWLGSSSASGSGTFRVVRVGGSVDVFYGGAPVLSTTSAADIRNLVIFSVRHRSGSYVYDFGAFGLNSVSLNY